MEIKVFIVIKENEALAVFDSAEKAFDFADFYEARHDYKGLSITARTMNET